MSRTDSAPCGRRSNGATTSSTTGSSMPLPHWLFLPAALPLKLPLTCVMPMSMSSVRWLRRAFCVRQRMGASSCLTRSTSSRTNVSRRAGDHQAALRWAELELEAAEELDVPEAIAFAYGDLGAVHLETGELDRAIELLERSAAVSESAGDRIGAARAGAQMGMALARAGDDDGAAEHLESVVSTLLHERLGDTGAYASVLFAHVLRRIGRSDEAEQQLL